MEIGIVWFPAFVLLLMFSIAGAMLFYKDGKIAKDNKAYMIVVIFAIVLSILAYFSMPDYLYVDKVIALIGGIAAATAFVMKERMFFLSKIILVASMSVNMVLAII